MYTEDEAKSKWCPFAKVGYNSGTEVNRITLQFGDEDFRCLGSECMAWRSVTPPHLRVKPCIEFMATVEPARPAGLPFNWAFVPYGPDTGPACWVEPEPNDPPLGYCGLAGVP